MLRDDFLIRAQEAQEQASETDDDEDRARLLETALRCRLIAERIADPWAQSAPAALGKRH